VFNLSGSDIVIILLLALIVLGPERLPDFIRRAGNVYGEIRRISQGFQTELRDALDEPMREIRETTDLAKSAFQITSDDSSSSRSAASNAAGKPATVDPVTAAEKASGANDAETTLEDHVEQQQPGDQHPGEEPAGEEPAERVDPGPPLSPFDTATTSVAGRAADAPAEEVRAGERQDSQGPAGGVPDVGDLVESGEGDHEETVTE
jgi:sec-independent protein translocase protein TatB